MGKIHTQLSLKERTIINRPLCHATWQIAEGRDRLVALRPCQTGLAGARE
jgi:hypothetical protein